MSAGSLPAPLACKGYESHKSSATGLHLTGNSCCRLYAKHCLAGIATKSTDLHLSIHRTDDTDRNLSRIIYPPFSSKFSDLTPLFLAHGFMPYSSPNPWLKVHPLPLRRSGVNLFRPMRLRRESRDSHRGCPIASPTDFFCPSPRRHTAGGIFAGLFLLLTLFPNGV